MRTFYLLLTIFTFTITSYAQDKDFRIIAYYSGSAEKISQYDVSNLTHIIHCFSHLKGNELHIGGHESIATLKKLVSLKKENPKLKVLLSLGGWTGCYTCSDVFSQEQDRIAFAKSVKTQLEKYGADGIDLDWEYPAVEGPPGHPYKPEDREHFTDLVYQLRQTLGDTYSISFAAGGFEDYFEKAIDWTQVAPLVDFINLMSYDLVNGYSKVTGHHTPLYSTRENPLSVDYGVKQMLSRGVPAEKIIIGMAFYGRIWEKVPDQNHGLYQSGTFKNSVSIRNIDPLKTDSSYQFYWDSVASAPWIYNKKLGLFYTYDDQRSVKLKTDYALDHDLGGVMFWELGLDHPRDGLLQAIVQEVKAKTSQ